MNNKILSNFSISKKSFIWNTIGCILEAASSFILLLCVTRTIGATEGGIFSLAFATAQILLTVGKFGVRSYQATDVKDEVEFGTYLVMRIWSGLGMLLLGIFYVIMVGYDGRKSFIFITVCIIKLSDVIEDVFHGQLQKMGRMDIVGKLLAFRNTATMLCFGSVLLITRNLLFGCVITAIISVGSTVVLNIMTIRRYVPVRIFRNINKERELFEACLPLFIGHFLSLYIYNAPKYAIDFMGKEAEIAVYSIIFMPAFVINLFSEFIFRPLLSVIASYWNRCRVDEFISVVKKMLLYIAGITIFVMLGAYIIGAWLLSIFYAVDVTGYKVELVILMLGGGFSAAVYLLYNVLTSMRKQKTIIVNYTIAAVLITIIAAIGVYRWKIIGGTVAFLFCEIVLFILMLVATIRECWEKQNKVKREN